MAEFPHSRWPETEPPDPIDADQSATLVLGQLTGNKGPAPGIIEDRRRGDDRRLVGWRAFVYGNFRPRRRQSRRDVDEHQFLFDWHEPRILYLALAILLLSCTDALFTLNLIQVGADEANKVMDSALSHSVERFLAVKIGVTSLSVCVLVVAARRKFFGLFRGVRLLQAVCVGYLAVIWYEIYLFRYVFELRFADGSLGFWPTPW